MNNSNTNRIRKNEIRFSLGPDETPEEQVFSNTVLVDRIWKHLPTQDMIVNALVSRAWHAKSRETLGASNSKRAVYIYIDNDSPCNTLSKFNTFLREMSRGTTLNPHMSFNGIQLLANPSAFLKRQCVNCLKKDLVVEEDNPPWDGAWEADQEQLVMDKLPQFFDYILDKFQFKYFRIHNYLTRYCPFACLMKYLLQTGRQNILELDFGGCGQYINHYLIEQNIPQNQNLQEFPNLEVFGVSHFSSSLHVSFPIRAPSLKKICHFSYDQSLNQLSVDFPRHAITSLVEYFWSAPNILEFVEEFHPTVEDLCLNEFLNPKTFTNENLFRLGKIVCASLVKLTCSPIILTLLANRTEVENENTTQNSFPALQTLVLECFPEETVGALDWLNCVVTRKILPKLHQVDLEFRKTMWKYDTAGSVNGPENLIIGDQPGFDQVKNLNLRASWESAYRVDNNTISWLILFKNVRHLNVAGLNTKVIQFKYTCDDHLFAKLLNQIDKFQFLKILTIGPINLRYFSLDHFFSENISGIKERLAGMNLEHLLIYQSSILHHKSLEQLNIQGIKVCSERINNAGEHRCYSDQAPGTFLVSARVARIICEQRPGFKFRLTINQPCTPECNSGFWPGGFRLEHLEPFASINYKQSRAGMFVTRFWEIEFLNLVDA